MKTSRLWCNTPIPLPHEADALCRRRVRRQGKQTRKELFLIEMDQVVPW